MNGNNQKSTKNSFINPDLSGLWCTAHLGLEKKWYSTILGAITLSIFLYSWIGGFFVPFFIIFLFYLQYYTIAIILTTLVLIPYLFPFSSSPMIARLYMNFGAQYFVGGCSFNFEQEMPCLTMEEKRSRSKWPVMITCHPHGIFCLGYFLTCGIRVKCMENCADEQIRMQYAGILSKFPDLERVPCAGLAVGYLLKFPIFNFFIVQLTGCVLSADNSDMKRYMNKQMSFGLLPGGFQEATVFDLGEDTVYIKNRKGFIKYALRYGYRVMPAYIFGETESYSNLLNFEDRWNFFKSFKYWLNKHKIPTVLPFGPYWYLLLPLLPSQDLGLHSIIGVGKQFPIIDDPTNEQINEYHAWYMGNIIALFDRNKYRFGMQDVQLKVC